MALMQGDKVSNPKGELKLLAQDENRVSKKELSK
jgi:hypothetical protein